MARRIFVLAFVCAALPRVAASSTVFFDDFSPQQAGWSFASPTAGYLGPLHNFYNVSSVTLALPGLAADPLALLEFDLLIFNSLDHDNCCTDTITMSVNASTMFTGAFSGADFDPVVQGPVFNQKSHFFTNPSGATTFRWGGGASPLATGTLNGFGLEAFWAWHFTVPVALLGGANTFTWSYVVNQPITQVDREAWGLDNVQITSSLPEPTTLALLGVGLGCVGLRRRKEEGKRKKEEVLS